MEALYYYAVQGFFIAHNMIKFSKTMVKKIKTNIKFYKGLNNADDRVYGFVTKVNSSWRGCRETEPKKKIVFTSNSITNIIPGALYKCTLIPMREKHGFIAESAVLVKFKGTAAIQYRNKEYAVIVEYGNKKILYNKFLKKGADSEAQRIFESLKNSYDLENSQAVAEDFINMVCLVKRTIKKEMKNV